MPEAEQHDIRALVRQKFPYYQRMPALFDKRCLLELKARQEAAASNRR